jgi:NADH-quinone oxidoreductase subunit N
MLLGIAFLYGSEKGSFMIDELAIGKSVGSPLMMVGLILIMVSMSFKVSAAPFHFWTPDVYDGACCIHIVHGHCGKSRCILAFIRLFKDSFGDIKPRWQIFIAITTAATLFIGNLTPFFNRV